MLIGPHALFPENLLAGFVSLRLLSHFLESKENAVSCSSAEVEYRSMASTICELKWITYILKDFQIAAPLSILLHCDNKVTQHIAANPVFHKFTKHLDINCYIVRDQVKVGFFHLVHMPSRLQLTDISLNL